MQSNCIVQGGFYTFKIKIVDKIERQPSLWYCKYTAKEAVFYDGKATKTFLRILLMLIPLDNVEAMNIPTDYYKSFTRKRLILQRLTKKN